MDLHIIRWGSLAIQVRSLSSSGAVEEVISVLTLLGTAGRWGG